MRWYWPRVSRAEREWARPGVNIAIFNLTHYQCWDLLSSVGEERGWNREKKCDETIKPSMTPFWDIFFLPSTLPPFLAVRLPLLLAHPLVQNFTICGPSTQSYAFFIPIAQRPHINPSVHAVLTRRGRAIIWMMSIDGAFSFLRTVSHTVYDFRTSVCASTNHVRKEAPSARKSHCCRYRYLTVRG